AKKQSINSGLITRITAALLAVSHTSTSTAIFATEVFVPGIATSWIELYKRIIDAERNEATARMATYIRYYDLGRRLHKEAEKMASEQQLSYETALRRTTQAFINYVKAYSKEDLRKTIMENGSQNTKMEKSKRKRGINIAIRARKLYRLVGERPELIEAL